MKNLNKLNRETFRPVGLGATKVSNSNKWLMTNYPKDVNELPYVEIHPTLWQRSKFNNQYHFFTKEEIIRDYKTWYYYKDISKQTYDMIVKGLKVEFDLI